MRPSGASCRSRLFSEAETVLDLAQRDGGLRLSQVDEVGGVGKDCLQGDELLVGQHRELFLPPLVRDSVRSVITVGGPSGVVGVRAMLHSVNDDLARFNLKDNFKEEWVSRTIIGYA